MNARRPSSHRSLHAKHLVGFLACSLLIELAIHNFYLARNFCQNQPGEQPNRIFRLVFTLEIDEDDKTATHVPRRQARQYDHSPRMKKRLLRFTGKPPKRTPPQVEAPLAEPAQPAEDKPRTRAKGVRGEFRTSQTAQRAVCASQDCLSSGPPSPGSSRQPYSSSSRAA